MNINDFKKSNLIQNYLNYKTLVLQNSISEININRCPFKTHKSHFR